MPGTILTFFAWAGIRRGRQGTGQATTVAFSIPESSLGFWIERLVRAGIKYQQPVRHFGEQVLVFRAGLDDFLECKHIVFKPGTINLEAVPGYAGWNPTGAALKRVEGDEPRLQRGRGAGGRGIEVMYTAAQPLRESYTEA